MPCLDKMLYHLPFTMDKLNTLNGWPPPLNTHNTHFNIDKIEEIDRRPNNNLGWSIKAYGVIDACGKDRKNIIYPMAPLDILNNYAKSKLVY